MILNNKRLNLCLGRLVSLAQLSLSTQVNILDDFIRLGKGELDCPSKYTLLHFSRLNNKSMYN